jgi:hypothetical protein
VTRTLARAAAAPGLAAALVALAATAGPAPGQAPPPVTKDQARAFWKEFDDNTFDGTGEAVNEVYLPGVKAPTKKQLAEARGKAHKDVFDGFGEFAGKAIELETLQAHGLPVPKELTKEVKDRCDALKKNGTLDRLSRLQLAVMRKHFSDGKGGIDFAKLQAATELFANGEIRTAPNAREMDQLHQWFVWKNFAAKAIDGNVDKAQWEQAIRSLQLGLEIYQRVYPSAKGELPLVQSTGDKFDMTKQLTEAQKTALRNEINGLTIPQLLARERMRLKEATTEVAAAPPAPAPRDVDIAVVQVTPAAGGGYDVFLQARVTDGMGDPVDGADLLLLTAEIGIEVPFAESFLRIDEPTGIGFGEYTASFSVPDPHIGYLFYLIDRENVAADSAAFRPVAVPGPPGLVLAGTAAAAGLVVRLRRRRSGGAVTPPG